MKIITDYADFPKAPKEVMKEFKNAPNSHTKGFLKAAEAEFS
jgi:hypothetical protein